MNECDNRTNLQLKYNLNVQTQKTQHKTHSTKTNSTKCEKNN